MQKIKKPEPSSYAAPVPVPSSPPVNGGIAPSTEISIFEDHNPRSVVNLVPKVVKESIEQHLFEHPELFDKDEQELHKYLRSDNRQPTPTDNRLRLKFWAEYDRVQAKGESGMSMVNVLAGVCSRELFYAKYLKSPSKVAWLLSPPVGYMVKAEEALEFGIEQLRDILGQPHIHKVKLKGVVGEVEMVDTKLGDLKAKIVTMLDSRVKGAVVQKTMNLNVSASHEAVEKATAAATMEDLERQLRELRSRERQSRNLPTPAASEVIEVEGKKV